MSIAKNIRVVALGIALLVLISLQVQIVSTPPFEIVWTDDFDDCTLDDWIITRGVFSAEMQTLWAYGDAAQYSNRAYHECQVEVGTWSFDILLREDWHWNYHPPTVRFMVDSLDPLDWQGYIIDFYTIHRMTGAIFEVQLRKHTEFWYYVDSYEYDEPADGWQHVEISRTSGGRITISLNYTQIIDTVDNSTFTSSYFLFDTEDCVLTRRDPVTRTDVFVKARESPMLDNLVVVEPIDDEYSSDTVNAYFVPISVLYIVLLLIGKNRITRYR
ncbi:MAG: hypothetical protein RTU92_05770 [Candidatus Thorarchaeota archaeon]